MTIDNEASRLQFFLAFGEGSLPQGAYYQAYTKEHWKDTAVPQRMDHRSQWMPCPDRPTFDDWQFDGQDTDGGSWTEPAGSEQDPA